MYDDWVKKSVYVSLYYGRLHAEKCEIERRMGVLQSMAADLIETGTFNFQNQNEFPMGKCHFSNLIHVLSKVANLKKEAI